MQMYERRKLGPSSLVDGHRRSLLIKGRIGLHSKRSDVRDPWYKYMI